MTCILTLKTFKTLHYLEIRSPMKSRILLALASIHLYLFPLSGDLFNWNCYETGPYAQVLGGLSFLDAECGYGSKLDMNTGCLISGSLGYRLPYGLRGEGEIAYRLNKSKNIDFFDEKFAIDLKYKTVSVMANLLWDLPLHLLNVNLGAFTPYIGVGGGYDNQHLSTDDFHRCIRAKNGIFGWQLMGGIRFQCSSSWDISLGYNYHASGTKGIRYQAVTLGASYNLW